MSNPRNSATKSYGTAAPASDREASLLEEGGLARTSVAKDSEAIEARGRLSKKGGKTEATEGTSLLAAGAPAKPEKKIHKGVYNVSLVLGYLSLVLELGYEAFTFQSLIPSFKKVMGANKKLKHLADVTAIPVAGVLTGGDALANFSTIDPKEAADFFGTAFADGIFPTLGAYGKKCVKQPFTVFLPTMSCLVTFMVGSYADVVTIREWLHKHGPFVEYGVISVALTLGTYFYTAAFGEATLNGYQYMLGNVNNHQNQRQKFLWEHMRDGKIAPAIQTIIESCAANLFLRPANFAYIMGLLFQQQEKEYKMSYDDSTKAAWQAVAALTTFLQAFPQRHSKSYNKFFGSPNRRLDLLTNEQLGAAYNLLIKNVTWLKFIGDEVKRAFGLVGIAECGLVGWGVSKLVDLMPNLMVSTNDSDAHVDLTSGIKVTAGVLAALAMHLAVYRRASIHAEISNFAFDHPDQITNELNRLAGHASGDAGAIRFTAPPADRDPNKTEEEHQEEELIIGKFAFIMGIVASVGTNTARGLTNAYFLMLMMEKFLPAIPEDVQFYVSIALAVVVSSNGYNMFVDYCTPNIQRYTDKAAKLGTWASQTVSNCIPAAEQENILEASALLRP